jgi:hypothetical protein
LIQVWDKNDWFYEGKHGFRAGYSCEIKVITVCQDIGETLEEANGIVSNITEFTKTSELVPHERLLMELAVSGRDSIVVVWVREFLAVRTKRIRGRGQLSKEVKITSGVPEECVLAHYCL